MSDISGLLNDLLAEIQDMNSYIDQKSWFFSGNQTYLILHGKSDIKTSFYNQDYGGTLCKYDQLDEDTVYPIMFYDPRYDLRYVQQYNQSYYPYAITLDTAESSQAKLVNLTSGVNTIINAASSNASTAQKWEAIRVYSAAKAMNKEDVLKNADTSNSYDKAIAILLSDSEISSAISGMVKAIRNNILGMKSDTMVFNSFKASINQTNLWYITDKDKDILDDLIDAYKSAIDELYRLASTAAENGGTIVICVNSINKSTIANNSYSYIYIAQIMTCIANETDVNIYGTDTNDLNSYYNEIIDSFTKKAKAKFNKKAIIITAIVCAAIILITCGIMLVFNTWKNSHIKKSDTTKEIIKVSSGTAASTNTSSDTSAPTTSSPTNTTSDTSASTNTTSTNTASNTTASTNTTSDTSSLTTSESATTTSE